MNDHTEQAFRFRTELAQRNLHRLKALCESGVGDALSLFSEQELEDMESTERAGD